jgi:hypothetical protein
MMGQERVLDYQSQVLKVGQVIVASDYRGHYKALHAKDRSQSLEVLEVLEVHPNHYYSQEGALFALFPSFHLYQVQMQVRVQVRSVLLVPFLLDHYSLVAVLYSVDIPLDRSHHEVADNLLFP